MSTTQVLKGTYLMDASIRLGVGDARRDLVPPEKTWDVRASGSGRVARNRRNDIVEAETETETKIRMETSDAGRTGTFARTKSEARMTKASRSSRNSAAIGLALELRAGLAMAARRDVRKSGNPWGIPGSVATALSRDGLIVAAVAHDPHNPSHAWPVWRITRLGREVLANGESE